MKPVAAGRRRCAAGTVPFLALLVVAASLPLAASPGAAGMALLTRDDDPVRIPGSRFPEIAGRPIADLALFRYDSSLSAFVPIPFQVDERVNHVFNPGTPFQFTETMYDVLHEDDGLLDGNDEIVFLFADAGGQAPAEIPWPSASDTLRFEIAAEDPRPGAPVPERWAYVFTGPSLPRSPTWYVTWNLAAAGSIASDLFQVEFSDRWLLTGLRVLPPCGSGEDLIDRAKGRAVPIVANEEDEERWNANSVFLGGILGPIRAIRYVRGAASAVNTIHYEVVYRGYWKRVLNLRVHPIAEARLYVDWRPTPPGTSLFTPLRTDGVAMDGQPDAGISEDFVEWSVVRHGGGGIVTLYDIPPSPLYGEKRFHYRDDLSWNDAIPDNPGYSDEDDSAYGDPGIVLRNVADCQVQAIPVEMHIYPVCAGLGDAELGVGYDEIRDNPFVTPVTPQWQGSGAVRTLHASRDGNDVVLTWQPLAGATAYRVYVATDADLPHSSWTLAGEPTASSFRDIGAAVPGADRYYSVVGLGPGGEGDW